jgi:NADPH-dependent 2,4-dienoyl-CoA reductase/sulfur reductase-like enzyme
VLRGEAEPEDGLVEPRDWYAQHGIDLRLETRVEGADLDARVLRLADGSTLGFERLVIASGAWPRRLGVPGADLEGVHTYRTIDDATAVRKRAERSRQAVVVGTGFIGLETTASLRTRGLKVTLIGSDHDLFGALGAPSFSEHLARVYAEKGVDLRLGSSLEAFVGDGELSGALIDGEEREAQLAIVGVGVQPSTAWLDGSGLEIDDGVVVDERYATGVDGVFACGDVARFQDPVFGKRRRIEHWSNANYQGAQLGRILAGSDERYDIVSTFFTEVFGTSYKVFGDSADADELVQEGDFAAGEAVLHYLHEGRQVAALLTGQSEEREAELKQAILERAPLAR